MAAAATSLAARAAAVAEAAAQAEGAERHGQEASPIFLAVGKAASEAESVCSTPWAGSAPRVGRAGSRTAGRAAVDRAHSDDGTAPASPAAEIFALAAPNPDDFSRTCASEFETDRQLRYKLWNRT